MKNQVSRSRRLNVALASVLAALALQVAPAQAEIVGSGELAAPPTADAEQAKEQAVDERTLVTQRLQAMGVDSVAAGERVGALDQQEVHALAQQLDALPAGGDFSNSQLMLILLGVILLVLIL